MRCYDSFDTFIVFWPVAILPIFALAFRLVFGLKALKEKGVQKAVINIKKKYGKNAILKGMNLREGATTMERNNQIGGHRA